MLLQAPTCKKTWRARCTSLARVMRFRGTGCQVGFGVSGQRGVELCARAGRRRAHFLDCVMGAHCWLLVHAHRLDLPVQPLCPSDARQLRLRDHYVSLSPNSSGRRAWCGEAEVVWHTLAFEEVVTRWGRVTGKESLVACIIPRPSSLVDFHNTLVSSSDQGGRHSDSRGRHSHTRGSRLASDSFHLARLPFRLSRALQTRSRAR